jgi:hypothetical protein
MYNLKLETNEILLSSIVNPYLRTSTSTYSSETISVYQNGRHCKHQSTSTGDDYPLWWLQLTTDLILSDLVTNQTEEKEKFLPSPSPRQDQSVQTEVEKSRPSSSSRSSHVQKSSSSVTSNHYQSIDEIDDGKNLKRILSNTDYQIENLNKRPTSSKQSDSDYLTFISTTDHHSHQTTCPICINNATRVQTSCPICLNNATRVQTKTSSSSTLLASLLERYERTLRERQRAFTIINDELLDIDDVLKRYRDKLHNSSSVRSTTLSTFCHYLLCIMD